MKMNIGKKIKKCGEIAAIFILAVAAIVPQQAKAQTAKKPNILVIFGDDIGQSNISAYPLSGASVSDRLTWCNFEIKC